MNTERWFSFRGLCSDGFGLEMRELPPRPAAAEKGESIAVPGRDGEVWIAHGGMEPIRLTLRCECADPDRNALADWLCAGEGRLVFSDEPDRAYIGRLEGGIGFGADGKTELRFVCEPWRYLEPPEPEIVLREPGSVWNGGAETLPLIDVRAEGDFTLTVGGTRIDAAAPQDGNESGLRLDSLTMDCLEADGTFAGGRVTMEEFPVLRHGENAIGWTGNVTEVRIARRLRTR